MLLWSTVRGGKGCRSLWSGGMDPIVVRWMLFWTKINLYVQCACGKVRKFFWVCHVDPMDLIKGKDLFYCDLFCKKEMSCVYKDRFSKKTATTRTQLSYNKPITKPFRRSTRSKKTLLKSGIPDMIPEKNVLLNIDRLMGVSPGFNGCTVDISLGQRV